MSKLLATNYPLEILRKSKATLETTIKGAPGLVVNPKMTLQYRAHIRELKRAIEYLELFEERKRRRFEQ